MNPHISRWSAVGDKFYAKVKLFTPNHLSSLNLNDCLSSFAPCGGALAFCRHPIAITGSCGVGKGEVKVFSGSGEYICTILNEGDPSLIKSIGWTLDERLVVVTSKGSVFIYSAIGELLDTFFFPESLVRGGVLHACVWNTGVAALAYRADGTIAGGLFNSFDPDSRIFQDLSPTPLSSSPVHFSYIGDTSYGTSFILSPETGSVALLTAVGYITPNEKSSLISELGDLLQSDMIEHVTLAPKGSLLALMTRNNRILVTNTDFNKFLLDFDLSTIEVSSSITSIDWCGVHAVSVSFADGSLALLAAIDGRPVYSVFDYFNPITISSEIDGLRVVSQNSIDFYYRVPVFVEDTFRYGSVAPSALLLDAFKSYEANKVEFDEMLRSIGVENLKTATNHLIDAAGFEFDPVDQKLLLRTANFGMLFLQDLDTEKFVDTCAKLKILNHLRNQSIGMSLTLSQFNHLSEFVLVKRLVFRSLYSLAFQVSQSLGLGTSSDHFVLVQWAIQKVKKCADRMTFTSLSKMIIDHLYNNSKKVPLSEIAQVAYRLGHDDLAVSLIRRESSLIAQVKCFLDMDKEAAACQVACSYEDVDLIHEVLLTVMDKDVALKRIGKPLRLPNLLRDFQLAAQVFSSLFKDVLLRQINAPIIGSKNRMIDNNNQKVSEFLATVDLKEALLDQGQPEEAAMYLIFKSFFIFPFENRIPVLRSAISLMNSSLSNSTVNRQLYDFSISVADLMIRFYDSHNLLQGSSTVCSGLLQCISNDPLASYKSISKTFHITDKKLIWLKYRSLLQAKDWSALNELVFVTCKGKPAIGFVPFAEACIDNNVYEEAAKYIARIPDPVERVELFLRARKYELAQQCLPFIKDRTALSSVKARISAKDQKAHLLIDEMMG
ncbi:hypothetical protein RCL1_001386 [Eukaryota sp. TZLM3-RCL]